MMAFIDIVTLERQHATLEPLALNHENDIQLAVADGKLWELWFSMISAPEDVWEYIEQLTTKR